MFRKEKRYRKWIFFLYVLIILRLIVFKHSYRELSRMIKDWNPDVMREGLRQANFHIFKMIRMYVVYYRRLNSFENLFGNVLVFVPYGIFYAQAFGGKRAARLFAPLTLLFITGMEIFQLVSGFGKFDVDDIFLNGLGALAGFAIIMIISHCRRNKNVV